MSSTITSPVPAVREARELVDAERLRIARDLHDVVAYSFATIGMQAGVAAHVVDERPEQAVEALRAIKAISGEASRELRAILGMLRTPGHEEAPRNGLGRLDALAGTFTRAGLRTRVVVSGAGAVAPAVDEAAYRIAQEALTNALRHAGPASATVTVTHEPERLVLEIVDDGGGGGGAQRPGPRAPGHGHGHGITGMRERAAAVGGRLHVARRPWGGFRVRASLPSWGAA